MKKLLLILSAIVYGIPFVQSQITFTTADLQESGKTYITKTDTLSIVDIGVASASPQIWDFSNLLMHYMSGPSFDNTSETAYASDYPNSDLYTYGPALMFGSFFGGAPVSEQGLDNGYMFWRKDVDGFWTEGFMADEGPYAGKKVFTIPQELILGTPASPGTNYPNFSEWTLTYDLNASDLDTVYSSTVDKTQNCDAWGEITTPTGTYTDVLRIHEYGVKVDSAKSYFAGNPLVFIEISRDTFNNYIFVTNGIHYPLAIVKADKNNVIKSVEYYFMQGFLETTETSGIEDAKIYPNPSNGQFTLELPTTVNQETVIEIADLNGNIVQRLSLQATKNNIDCSMLNPGIYYYRVGNDMFSQFGKIVLQ